MTVIEIENLRKTYKSRTALDGISLTVDGGEILGIAGTNGAGKTTLVECASGLRRRDSGVLRVLGMDPQTDRRALQSSCRWKPPRRTGSPSVSTRSARWPATASTRLAARSTRSARHP
ncbi:ATP-binding cassette domain-containing protein [Kribbella sp. NPDC054772]